MDVELTDVPLALSLKLRGYLPVHTVQDDGIAFLMCFLTLEQLATQ